MNLFLNNIAVKHVTDFSDDNNDNGSNLFFIKILVLGKLFRVKSKSYPTH